MVSLLCIVGKSGWWWYIVVRQCVRCTDCNYKCLWMWWYLLTCLIPIHTHTVKHYYFDRILTACSLHTFYKTFTNLRPHNLDNILTSSLTFCQHRVILLIILIALEGTHVYNQRQDPRRHSCMHADGSLHHAVVCRGDHGPRDNRHVTPWYTRCNNVTITYTYVPRACDSMRQYCCYIYVTAPIIH